jgi:hypothetical protein
MTTTLNGSKHLVDEGDGVVGEDNGTMIMLWTLTLSEQTPFQMRKGSAYKQREGVSSVKPRDTC